MGVSSAQFNSLEGVPIPGSGVGAVSTFFSFALLLSAVFRMHSSECAIRQTESVTFGAPTVVPTF